MASATHLLARSDHSHLYGTDDLNHDDDDGHGHGNGLEEESSSDSLCESEFIPYQDDGEIVKGGGGGEEEEGEGEEFGHGFSTSSSLSRCSSSNSIVIGSSSSDQSFGCGRTDQTDLVRALSCFSFFSVFFPFSIPSNISSCFLFFYPRYPLFLFIYFQFSFLFSFFPFCFNTVF